jgi:hypothetical protein
MKGGERMLHIILDRGRVIQVIELGKNPEEVKYLQEEFDYKVEDLDEYRIMESDKGDK